jgi:hypothetical protein
MRKHVPPFGASEDLLRELHNLAELGGSESVDGEARLADQGNVFQWSPRFNLVQGYGVAQRFDWRKIDRAPIAFFCRGIGVRGADDFSYTDDRFIADAVIKENFITHAHAAEIVSRGKITHTGPTGLLFFDQIAPRIRIRF